MEREFCPYEIALALKEIGFDEPCYNYYDDDNKEGVFQLFPYISTIGIKTSERIKNQGFENTISSPLFQQAFKFFRERYNIYVNIDYDWNDEVFRVIIMQQNSDKSCRVIHLKEYDYIKEYRFYEEAELECLKKLIKIAQNR